MSEIEYGPEGIEDRGSCGAHVAVCMCVMRVEDVCDSLRKEGSIFFLIHILAPVGKSA